MSTLRSLILRKTPVFLGVVACTVLVGVFPLTTNAQLSSGQGVAIGVGSFGAGLLLGGGLNSTQLAAQQGAITAANAMCTPVNVTCGCNLVPDPKHPGSCIAGTNMFQCACWSVTNGFKTTGVCSAQNMCLGQSAQGLNGQSSSLSGGFGGLDSALNDLLKASMIASMIQGMVNGGGSASSGSGSATGVTGACLNGYYQTSVPSSDPCAQYNPSPNVTPGTTNTGSTASDLVNALNGNTSQALQNALNNSCPAISNTCGVGYHITQQGGTDASGCASPPVCTADNLSASTTNICPTISKLCDLGYHTQDQTGTDSAGCSLGPQCVADNPSANTPNTCPARSTICDTGYHLLQQSGNDLSGCALPARCAPDAIPDITTPTIDTTQATASSIDIFNLAPDTANPNNITTNATTNNVFIPVLPGTGGVSGDIRIGNNGVTFFGSTMDTQSNSVTAGFYGSDTFGSQNPQGLAGEWCQDRPWASNFLSFIIPPTFFDSLCTWRGFQVGTPPATLVQAAPATPQPILTQNVIKNTSSVPTVSSSTTPLIPPHVQIWSVPSTVSIGARVSIFWNTQGVTNCSETSPDGSFTQNSLAGGASTVPLTGATTYTISCIAPDGTPVTDYVTVNLAI